MWPLWKMWKTWHTFHKPATPFTPVYMSSVSQNLTLIRYKYIDAGVNARRIKTQQDWESGGVANICIQSHSSEKNYTLKRKQGQKQGIKYLIIQEVSSNSNCYLLNKRVYSQMVNIQVHNTSKLVLKYFNI